MSNELTIVKQSYELIRKDLGLEEEWGGENTDNPFDRLREFLVPQINYLLDHDFNRLLNALYRIDLSESDLKRILSLKEHVAEELTLAIIDREKKKVLTRLAYRTSKS